MHKSQLPLLVCTETLPDSHPTQPHATLVNRVAQRHAYRNHQGGLCAAAKSRSPNRPCLGQKWHCCRAHYMYVCRKHTRGRSLMICHASTRHTSRFTQQRRNRVACSQHPSPQASPQASPTSTMARQWLERSSHVPFARLSQAGDAQHTHTALPQRAQADTAAPAQQQQPSTPAPRPHSSPKHSSPPKLTRRGCVCRPLVTRAEGGSMSAAAAAAATNCHTNQQLLCMKITRSTHRPPDAQLHTRRLHTASTHKMAQTRPNPQTPLLLCSTPGCGTKRAHRLAHSCFSAALAAIR
jgi:hypothetical protein